MKQGLSIVLLCFAFVACSPKPALELNIRIHRTDLTSIEIVATFIDSGGEAIRCRIYRQSASVLGDECQFENSDDVWDGELRGINDADDEDSRLRFLFYGEASTTLKITVAGFVNDKIVSSETKDLSLGDRDDITESDDFEILRQTQVHHACEFEFVPSADASTQLLGDNVALSLIKNNAGGFDVVAAVGGGIQRLAFDATGGEERCLSVHSDFNLGNAACFVRFDQMVIGNIDDSPSEEIVAMCQPLPPPLASQKPRILVANSDLPETESFSETFPRPASLNAWSALVLAPSSTSAAGMSVYALNGAMTPQKETLLILHELSSAASTGETEYKQNTLHEYRNVRPIFECTQNRPNCTQTRGCNSEDRIPVVESGCVNCDKIDSFRSPPSCAADEVILKTSAGASNNTWKCISRAECLLPENLAANADQIRVAAPFPPIFYEEADAQKYLIAGYPGGFGYWSESEGKKDRAYPQKLASMRKPVLVKNEDKNYLVQDQVAADEGMPPMGMRMSMPMGKLTLQDASSFATLAADTTPSVLEVNQTRSLSYAVGTSTSTFVVFGQYLPESLRPPQTVSAHLELTEVDLFKFAPKPQGSPVRELSIAKKEAGGFEESPGPMSIRLASIDINPGVDTILFRPGGTQIHAYRTVGNSIKSVEDFPIQTKATISQMLLADLDGDGAIEIVILNQTKLKIYSLGLNSYDAANLPWPMHRRDRKNSGYYTGSADPL